MNGIIMVFYLLVLFIVGTILGSFACCQAWRIKYKVEKKQDLGKRSVCLNCGKQLGWRENIPIVSWVKQKGKCKKCGNKIGVAEILTEIFMGVAIALIGVKFQSAIFDGEIIGILKFLTALIMSVVMAIMFIYDAKWKELPVITLIISNVLGVMYLILNICGIVMSGEKFGANEIYSILAGIAILAGVYYLLYVWSKEKMVGGGDWILCLAIALVLADWWLALVVLFLSNFLGSIVMAPLVYAKKKSSQIAFGPFLIVAFLIVFLLSDILSSLGVEALMHLF